jgi:hypothetical protein
MSLAALVIGLVLLGWAGSSRAQFVPHVPLGPEFQVNAFTTGFQGTPRVASLGTVGYVIVWQSEAQDGNLAGVFGRRFTPNGVPLGSDFPVNTYTTGQQFDPSVASLGSGFVVVWNSGAPQDGSGSGIFGQRYDAFGAPDGGEFQVNSYTTFAQDQPAVATDGSGNTLVAWRSSQDGHVDGVFGRVFDSGGTAVGPDFQVNTYTTSDQRVPAVAGYGGGGFVVVWQGALQDGSSTGIFGQRFANSGAPVGPEFAVNEYTTGGQEDPAVATDTSGNFLVLWESGQDGAPFGIQGRRFDGGAVPYGPEFQVNTYTTDNQSFCAVAADGAGNFITAWGSNTQDGDLSGVFAQRYDGGGLPLAGEFQVNTYTTDQQEGPAVAGDAQGNFLVTWASTGQDGSFSGIYARRYTLGQRILGKKLIAKNPSGESQRRVIVLAKETDTDITPPTMSSPSSDGATLRMITKGTTDSDQTFILDAAGWSALGGVGWKYSGPTGADGDPVRKVIIKRTPSGRAILKVVLVGSIGTQSLDVIPPNAGDEAGLILTLNGPLNSSATYCVGFAGAAGGEEGDDDAALWKIKDATAEPGCPTPP